MLDGHEYRVRAEWCGGSQSVVYDVSSGPERRVDILAQAERAARWVAWAHAERQLVAEAHRLLVVGGGLAGCAAALAARAVGVQVDIVDATGDYLQPMGALPSARRKIHPTLYRWPSSDWRNGSYLEVAPDVPGDARIREAMVQLGWIGGRGSEVFAPLAEHCVRSLKGTWFRGCLCGPTATVGERLGLEPSPDGPAYVVNVPELAGRTYHRVLVCTGPGAECVGFPDPPDQRHQGYLFWDPRDRLVRRLDGEIVGADPFALGSGEIVIVGAGDGGRQDLVQVLSGLHILDLVERLDDDDDGWFAMVTKKASRLLEGITRNEPPAAEAALAPFARQHGEELLRRMRDLGGPSDELLRRTALYSMDPYGPCFHLNRFLTLALDHASLTRSPAHRLLRFGERLIGLGAGSDHGDADACWGDHHDAEFTTEGGPAHFIVIRRGLPTGWFWDRPEWKARLDEARLGA